MRRHCFLSPRDIVIVETEEAVVEKLGSVLRSISSKAIEEKGKFVVGLSGGSLVGSLSKCLTNFDGQLDKWILTFCDERYVPFNDPESTYGVYRKALCDNGPLKPEQFVIIDSSLPLAEAAKDYADKLKRIFPKSELPQFDALLLGMGPDGHTCSLFPNHPGLSINDVWVAPIQNSPKPPPERITLTFPVINNASNCIFAIFGQGKAGQVKTILKDNEPLPAGMVLPTSGKVMWILDKAAASLL